MRQLKTVKEPRPGGGRTKPKSGVSYPYYDLRASIEVAKTIHNKAGGSCTREQLAPLLNYSGVKNGGFLTRLSAAKMFGLVEEDSQGLRVTDRAQSILSPVMPDESKRAKVDAFLAVELFQKVYEKFKGQALPADVGLKNLLQTAHQIVPDRVAPALRVLKESADEAGFFSSGRDRLVMPIFAGKREKPPAHNPPPNDEGGGKGGNAGGASGGGAGGDGSDKDIDPAIYGLIRRLPAVGTPMPKKKRDDLVNAFTALVTFLYPEQENEP